LNGTVTDLKDKLKEFGRKVSGAIVEFFWHMPGRPEENYENLSQGS
jgi:hypothetical protein